MCETDVLVNRLTVEDALPSIGVVIRCLNEERHIGRLLAGLERQTCRPDQIVVVDSGSTDATLDIVSRYTSDIAHIKKDEFSFGRALNIGCEAASTDLLVFVSAHVYPIYDSYLERLTTPFADPEVVLTYGRQVGDHRTKYSESRIMLKWFPATSIPRQDHPFCNNANAAIRRSAWLEQHYDEELTGLEDIAWAKSAQQRGHAISYVAEAPVVHVHEEAWKQTLNRYRREAIAYKRIVGERHLKPLEAVALTAGNTVSDYLHAAREGVLLSNLAGIPSFRFAQFLGAWQGHSHTDHVSEGLKRRLYYPLDTRAPTVAEVSGNPIDYTEHMWL
jgi:rhamnosyltransferase